MKANELMIDDWVYNKNIDKPMRVYPTMFSQMFRQRPDATTEDYNIFPIPLTPEILEKNGFRECVWFGQNAWSRDYLIFNSVTICIDGRDGGLKHFGYLGYQSMIVIDYVHQLQHALRLCGIDETIEI